MARYYDSFQKLKENVSETYGNIAMLIEKFDWGFFSEEGQNKIEAYAILDDAFMFAADFRDLVQFVSNEISKLEGEIKTAKPEDAAEKREVIKLLAKYIRNNLEDDLWQDFPAFDKNHAERGC